MCKWYAYHHLCEHNSYVLGKLCPDASRVQTACKMMEIWQTFEVEEGCDACCKAAEEKLRRFVGNEESVPRGRASHRQSRKK